MAALLRMVRYSKQDVVLLEEWFNKLNRYIKPKTHATGIKSDCPECGGDKIHLEGMQYMASGYKKQRCSCTDCGKKFYYKPKKVD